MEKCGSRVRKYGGRVRVGWHGMGVSGGRVGLG